MKFSDLKLMFYKEAQKARLEASKNSVRFVSTAYDKVLKIVSCYYKNDEIATEKKINELPITEHMQEKLIWLLKKKMSKAENKKTENTQKVEKLKLDLMNLLGIGGKKVEELTHMGLTSMGQLREKKFYDILGKDTKLMLEHNPVRKIPYDGIKKIEMRLVSFPLALVRLAGSFRRKLPYSKDIDILVKSDDPTILNQYIDYLIEKFNGKVFVYAKGVDKTSLIIQPFENDSKTKYKLDIFRSASAAYHANLLYSTGPKEYNIKIRTKAKKMGYLLNQNGLFKKRGSSVIKINCPKDDERKILSYIEMPYVEPENRY
jgi:DNA polymerase/3'-5' exonuclease PolX